MLQYRDRCYTPDHACGNYMAIEDELAAKIRVECGVLLGWLDRHCEHLPLDELLSVGRERPEL